MGEVKWRTINKAKLESEIDKLAAEIDTLTRGKERTRDTDLAVRFARASATHDALVLVYNSLD
jgi:flagellin-like hook-associated protein FlgL